ncbi:MAG: o-succinylbenzoate synthase [Chloroflexi bacterium]|nr:o-succinylbenzoate synthase [Chloroflexota bacterium]
MLHITAHPYSLQFKRPAATSRGSLHTRAVVFLRATDSEQPGIGGWGECGPLPGLSVDDRPDFLAQVTHICGLINRGQPVEALDLTAFPSLIFGLEMAQRDLYTGGQQRLFSTPFSRGEAPLATHGLIWMDTPANVLQQIESKLAQGFRVIKLKVGALPLADECAMLATIRQHYPADKVTLRLDANGAFTPENALENLHQLAKFDIHFLEQPLRAGQAQAMAAICATSPIPIALDEELIGVREPAARRALVETIRPQHLIIKPALLGGLAISEEWIRLAESLGCAWWINSMLESNLGLNALCQWTSRLDNQRVHGLGTGQLFTNNIPAPLRLEGPLLSLDPTGQWDLTVIDPRIIL